MATNPPYPAQELGALQLTGKRRISRAFGRLRLVVLLASPFVLAFAPWQQNLPGEGRVIEFDPVHRPMPIQARTDGLLLKWHVREGDQVKAGAPLVDLADNDPRILDRLQEQLTAATQKRDAGQRKREQYAARVTQAEQARAAAIRVADDQIAAAVQLVEVARQNLTVAESNARANDALLQVSQAAIDARIAPGFELFRAKAQAEIARAEVTARKAAIQQAEAAERAARSNKTKIESDEQGRIQSATADRDGADGEVADAEGTILRLQRDLERQKQQQLVAPLDGFVQNLRQNGQGGGFVKQGTTLLTLVPRGKQMAVELLVDGNDVTFIDVGRHVRLQFEGWPAVQWVGWPSAAVGTFGGKVAFIDRFDNGAGKYRVMVLPDERPFTEPEGPVVDWLRRRLTFEKVSMAGNPHAWPGEPWLRQGLRAKGWIVLDRVSLGFEVWRQLNGFPPSVKRPETEMATPKDDGGGK